MRKRLEIEALNSQTGEATVRLAAFTKRDGRFAIEKRAFAESHSPLYEYLKHIQPEPGITYILVNALGSYEFYGANRNGDGFNERPYKQGIRAKCGHPECTKSLDGWVQESETLLQHYRTFEKHAGIYEHHQNRDKSKSLGDVKHAIWNPFMHRTELLLRYVNERNPRIPERLGSGDDLAVSMGCRVLYDVCTICGHHAPTRKDYCEHARYHLRQVLADGSLVAVLNPSPLFFDISFVVKPADQTGWALMKVAHPEGPLVLSSYLGEEDEAHEVLRTSFEKVATDILDAWGNPLSFMGQYVATVGASSTTAISPQSPQPQAAIVKHAASEQGVELGTALIERLTLATPGLVAFCGRYPEYLKEAALGPSGDILRQTAFGDPDLDIGPGALFRAAEPPKTDVLSITDPFTGTSYQTTRGDAMRAETSSFKRKLLNTALFSALYAAGLHKALKNRPGLTLPASLLLGHMTARKVEDMFAPARNPLYMTDQNVPISGLTEFKQASQRTFLDDRWATKLAMDITACVGSYAPATLLNRQQNHPLFMKWASLTPAVQADVLCDDGRSSFEDVASALAEILL